MTIEKNTGGGDVKPGFLCEKIDRRGYQGVEVDGESDVVDEDVDLCEDVVDDVHEEGLQLRGQTRFST